MLISVGQLIRETWRLFLAHWKALIKYSLASFLVSMIINMVGASLAFFGLANQNGWTSLAISIVIVLVIIIASMYLGAWFNTAMLKAGLITAQTGSVPPLKAALKDAKPLIWRVIGVMLASGLILILPLFIVLSAFAITRFALSASSGSLAAQGLSEAGAASAASPIINLTLTLLGIASIIYMIIFSVKLAFTVFGVVFENKKIGESFRMSLSMVKGRWWAILWRVIAPAFVFLLLLLALVILIMGIEYLAGNSPIMNAVGSLVSFAFQIIFAPLFILPGILLYQSAKQTSSSTPTPPPPMATV